ncbi:MAG: cytochrome c [Phycisphaerales bacterium]
MHQSANQSNPCRGRLAVLAGLVPLSLALIGCAEPPADDDGTTTEASAATGSAAPASAPIDDMSLRILGRQVYDESCLVCHQADGQGVPWMQPALAAAEGVLVDDAEPIVELLLRGVGGDPATGAMSGTGEWSQAMPTFAGRTDEELAAVITYIRHAWDNDAAPVAPATVTRVRARVDAAMAAKRDGDGSSGTSESNPAPSD